MTHKILKLFLLLLVLLGLAESLSGQYNTDAVVEGKPHQLQPYFPDQDTSGIKSVAIVTTFDRIRNRENDTSFYKQYDRSGFMEVKYGFENGVRKDTLYTEYNESGSYRFQYEPKNPEKLQTEYSREINADGQKVKTMSRNLKGRDTILTREHLYFYQDGQLIRKEFQSNGKINRTDSLFYENGLLKEYRTTDIQAGNRRVSTSYQYDSAGNLLNRKINQDHPIVVETEDVDYKYENGRIVEKSIRMRHGAELSHKVLFDYYPDGKLKSVEARKDEKHRKIEFHYEDGRKSAVQIETNAWNGAWLEYHIPFNIFGAEMPCHVTELYKYDEKGRLIRKEHYLEEELVKLIEYHIEYYEE